MDEFLTLKTFTQYHELSVIRARLEYEGIETFVPDELTVQTNPLYSNAIGGLRLQVKQSDIAAALTILGESGQDAVSKNTRIEDILERQSKYKILQKINPTVLLLVTLAIFIGGIVTTIFLFTRSSNKALLLDNIWCVDYIDYNGKTFIPNTDVYISLNGPGFCAEEFGIRENGSIHLPGFNSRAVEGRWSINNDSMSISKTDTFDFVYNGTYHLNIQNSKMVLSSPTTTIYCFCHHFNYPFPF